MRIKNYSTAFILLQIDSSKNPEYLYIARNISLYQYKKMIPKLLDRIINDTVIGLNDSADMILLQRPEYGSHGGMHGNFLASDDLFKVSGRANYLLKYINNQNFGDVNVKSSKQDLQELQCKWIQWFNNMN